MHAKGGSGWTAKTKFCLLLFLTHHHRHLCIVPTKTFNNNTQAQKCPKMRHPIVKLRSGNPAAFCSHTGSITRHFISNWILFNLFEYYFYCCQMTCALAFSPNWQGKKATATKFPRASGLRHPLKGAGEYPSAPGECHLMADGARWLFWKSRLLNPARGACYIKFLRLSCCIWRSQPSYSEGRYSKAC